MKGKKGISLIVLIITIIVVIILAAVVIITINKKIIRKSSQTVFTSEGFSKFYFGEINPENVSFIPNKVSVECFDLPTKQKEIIDFNKLRFGFVGAVRYNCLFNFAKVLL